MNIDGSGEAGAVGGEERARGEAGHVRLPGPDGRAQVCGLVTKRSYNLKHDFKVA